VLNERVRIAARDVMFANLRLDPGTVNSIKSVHALTASPSLLPEGIPLEPYEMSSWDAGDCRRFFNETVQEVSEKGLEICSIICDNSELTLKVREVF
jgi:hypothetical protein